MGRTLLENAAVVDPESEFPPGVKLLLGDERILDLLAPGAPTPDDAFRVDLRGAYLCPGFIDLHVHGSLIFHDAADLPAALAADGASMARHGTTAFLATTVTDRSDALAAFVTQLASSLEAPVPQGALPIGIHLEGPWINPGAAGAQPPGPIRGFDARQDTALIDRAEGVVKLVTLAPEMPGASELLELLTHRGVIAALGHSLADAACVDDAVARGARHVTHLFNAMGPLHHRAPGLVGVALADDRLSCDLICDGVHVHPPLVSVAARAKGEGLVLITDRIDPPDPAAGGLGSGPLHRDGEAWRMSGGELAGSGIGMDTALRNLVEFAGVRLRDAVAACTLRPARLLGQEAQRGSLRPGARADLTVLDSALRVRQTWIGGAPVYVA